MGRVTLKVGQRMDASVSMGFLILGPVSFFPSLAARGTSFNSMVGCAAGGASEASTDPWHVASTRCYARGEHGGLESCHFCATCDAVRYQYGRSYWGPCAPSSS